MKKLIALLQLASFPEISVSDSAEPAIEAAAIQINRWEALFMIRRKACIILAIILAVLCGSVLPASAATLQTKAVLLGTFQNDHTECMIIRAGDVFITSEKDGDVLRDSQGGIIPHDHYDKIRAAKYVRNADFANFALVPVACKTDEGELLGVINETGHVIVPLGDYTDLRPYSDQWVAAVRTIPVKSNQDYGSDTSDTKLRITTVDIFYDGTLIATLDREEIEMKHVRAYGNYLYIKGRDNRMQTISSTGIRHLYPDSYSIYDQYHYEKGIITHPGTGSVAFDESCTLDPDEVIPALYHESGRIFRKLHGELIGIGPNTRSSYGEEYPVNGYLELKDDLTGLMGLYTADGTEVLPPEYEIIGGAVGEEDMRKNFYFAYDWQAVVKDGKIGYVNKQGVALTDFRITFRDDTVKGLQYENRCFIWMMNPENGKMVIISPLAGILFTEYDQAANPGSSACRCLAVAKDGKYGVIDLYGNEIIACKYKSAPVISFDGTLVAFENGTRKIDVYRIDYEEIPDPEETPAETTEWTCPACGEVNNGNFCRECGTKRPEKARFCRECGYKFPEDYDFVFCPECGTKIQ